MRLIGNRVLVEPVIVTQWRGIYIPEDITHKDNPFMDERIGIVRAIGNGRRTKNGARIPISAQVGDKVLLPRSGMKRVTINGEGLWMIDADMLLGKLE